jgi:hypothetical protein
MFWAVIQFTAPRPILGVKSWITYGWGLSYENRASVGRTQRCCRCDCGRGHRTLHSLSVGPGEAIPRRRNLHLHLRVFPQIRRHVTRQRTGPRQTDRADGSVGDLRRAAGHRAAHPCHSSWTGTGARIVVLGIGSREPGLCRICRHPAPQHPDRSVGDRDRHGRFTLLHSSARRDVRRLQPRHRPARDVPASDPPRQWCLPRIRGGEAPREQLHQGEPGGDDRHCRLCHVPRRDGLHARHAVASARAAADQPRVRAAGICHAVRGRTGRNVPGATVATRR